MKAVLAFFSVLLVCGVGYGSAGWDWSAPYQSIICPNTQNRGVLSLRFNPERSSRNAVTYDMLIFPEDIEDAGQYIGGEVKYSGSFVNSEGLVGWQFSQYTQGAPTRIIHVEIPDLHEDDDVHIGQAIVMDNVALKVHSTYDRCIIAGGPVPQMN